MPTNPSQSKSSTRRKSNTRRYQTATRNVGLQYAPQYQQIQQEQQNAQADYLNQLQAARSAYGGYQQEIAPYGQQYSDLSSQIGNNLMSQLQGLQGVYPTGMPSNESSAVSALANALGTTGFNTLASEAQRNLDYQTSAQREGALSQRYAADTLGQQLSNQLRGFSDQRLNLAAQQPAMIQSEVDRLRQQSIENQLAQSQIAGNNALNQYVQNQIGGYLNPGGGNQGGGQVPAPGTGPANTYPVPSAPQGPGPHNPPKKRGGRRRHNAGNRGMTAPQGPMLTDVSAQAIMTGQQPTSMVGGVPVPNPYSYPQYPVSPWLGGTSYPYNPGWQ